MTEPIEPLLTAVRRVRMTDTERGTMQRTLEAYMATYRPQGSVRAFVGRHALGTSLTVLLMIAGGATALAQRALPDSPLYDLRVAVNDRIEVMVSGDEDAQLNAELGQIQRSLDDEEIAYDDETSSLAQGIPDEDIQEGQDRSDQGEQSGVPGDDPYAFSSGGPVLSPMRFDDGADIELNSIGKDLESAAKETPDIGN